MRPWVHDSTMNMLAPLIRRRLEELDSTPYAVSVASGHRPGWLSEVLRRVEGRRPDRLSGEVGLTLLSEVAGALGLPVGELAEAAIGDDGEIVVYTSGDVEPQFEKVEKGELR